MEENLGLIIAIVGSSLSIIMVILAMFLWLRSEANSDRRAFTSESRDFHGRMIALEQRKDKKKIKEKK